MNKRHRGFTMTEIVVVMGIIIILLSLAWPSFAKVQYRARKAQCANNLTQLHRALTMYSIDNGQLTEVYPAYLTNLYVTEAPNSDGTTSGYITDDRIFICPADNSKATVNSFGVTSLKPMASASVPLDNKASWAERFGNTDPNFGNLLNQRNCSFLYEFSGRICQVFQPDSSGGTFIDNSPSSFISSSDPSYPGFLVDQTDPSFPVTPYEVVRDGIKLPDNSYGATGEVVGITWQEAKLYQLMNGDIYCTGQYSSTDGGFPEPPSTFTSPDGTSGDPIDYYTYQFSNSPDWDYSKIVTSYSRSWMPIMRCFWHQSLQHIDSEAFEEVQNMSIGGIVFDSSPFWERTAFKYGSKVGDYSDQ